MFVNPPCRFGPIPNGLRDSLNAIADPEKLRALHRIAIISDSLTRRMVRGHR